MTQNRWHQGRRGLELQSGERLLSCISSYVLAPYRRSGGVQGLRVGPRSLTGDVGTLTLARWRWPNAQRSLKAQIRPLDGDDERLGRSPIRASGKERSLGAPLSDSDGGLVAVVRRPHAPNETSTIEAPTREQVQQHANDRLLRVVNSYGWPRGRVKNLIRNRTLSIVFVQKRCWDRLEAIPALTIVTLSVTPANL
jgi:hypothetical protein